MNINDFPCEIAICLQDIQTEKRPRALTHDQILLRFHLAIGLWLHWIDNGEPYESEKFGESLAKVFEKEGAL